MTRQMNETKDNYFKWMMLKRFRDSYLNNMDNENWHESVDAVDICMISDLKSSVVLVVMFCDGDNVARIVYNGHGLYGNISALIIYLC